MRQSIINIDKNLRKRIRVIVWKQWKKITRREKALFQLGVESTLAHNIACTRKGYYQICKTIYV